MKNLTLTLLCVWCLSWFSFGQDAPSSYKKRVLETSEIEMLFSYYGQDGDKAAVTGGEGTQKLNDATSTVVLKLPMNADDVLTVDIGISAYSSASSSNVNPLDGNLAQAVSPYNATSGASRSDVLTYAKPSYQHSSEDRNTILDVSAYISSEYDYFSVGIGAGITKLFNEQNTEVSLSGQVYLDKWNPQYPIELRDGFFDDRVEGDGTYNPQFQTFDKETRNSYSVSLSVSQILSVKAQISLFMDIVSQQGLLSTPFQRVYFGDVENYFIDDFQLADDVERLPDSRFKIPVGARFNYYLTDGVVLRTYYRYYYDDWGITSHTAQIEVPIKLGSMFTISPNYRFYSQSKADYFYGKEEALSTAMYYTSDYDLATYNAHQYGMAIKYKDIFTKTKVLNFGLKTVALRFAMYNRDTGLNATIISLGTVFVGL